MDDHSSLGILFLLVFLLVFTFGLALFLESCWRYDARMLFHGRVLLCGTPGLSV